MRALAILLFALGPALASAQSWDFSLAAIYQDSLSVGGEGGPETPTPDSSSLDVDSELGWGGNITYNFNKHFALGLDIDYLSPDYELKLVSDTPTEPDVFIDHNFTQWNFRLKGTWNFTEGPLIPYVDFGYAWTDIDSNVADGPPVTGCWWHPWWGYICNTWQPTYNASSLSYQAGIGVRGDIGDACGMKDRQRHRLFNRRNM